MKYFFAMPACNEYVLIINIGYNEGIFMSDAILLRGSIYKHIFGSAL